jgi:4-hydroxy-tetrahydrodipicolinate synthase
MARHPNFEPKGVIPACILPFHEDLSIDEGAYRRHLRHTADISGVSAITVNAHATEVASCSFEEQRYILEMTMDEIGDRVPVVNGVYADGSAEAARLARMAEDGGASCLLVFPPNPFVLGQTPAMVLAHFQAIADATGLPLIAFQYPLAGGQGYPMETLLQLVDRVPSVRAIKDWCNVVPQHERHVRVLQSLPRRVNVLTTHSSWLFSSLVLGCRGLLSGMGSVVADLQSALFDAVQANDLVRARALNDRLNPIASAFYADPFVDMHNRMKAALVLLGRIPCAAVRPPLVKVGPQEIERIRIALDKAQVSREGAMLEAA